MSKKRVTKRQVRERRRAKAKRRDMYQNDVAGCDFAELETRVLSEMEKNQGFKTGEDLYGGHPIGSPERNAAKMARLREMYSVSLQSTTTGRSGND